MKQDELQLLCLWGGKENVWLRHSRIFQLCSELTTFKQIDQPSTRDHRVDRILSRLYRAGLLDKLPAGLSRSKPPAMLYRPVGINSLTTQQFFELMHLLPKFRVDPRYLFVLDIGHEFVGFHTYRLGKRKENQLWKDLIEASNILSGTSSLQDGETAETTLRLRHFFKRFERYGDTWRKYVSRRITNTETTAALQSIIPSDYIDKVKLLARKELDEVVASYFRKQLVDSMDS